MARKAVSRSQVRDTLWRARPCQAVAHAVCVLSGITWWTLSAEQGDAQVVGGDEPVEWGIADRPRLEIGGSDRGPTSFGAIVGVLRLATGAIVVGDGMARELRFFDPTGGHLASVGGNGEGPGEFRTMRPPLACAGDTIWVWDPALGRVSLYSAEGTFLRQETLPRTDYDTEWAPWSFACNDGGGFAVVSRSALQMVPRQEGPMSVDVRVEITSPRGDVVLGPFPGEEAYAIDGMIAPRPLGRATRVALGADRVYVGVADRFSIDVYDFDGQLLLTVGDGAAPLELTGRRQQAFIDDVVSGSRDPESSRRFYQRIDFPDRLPAFDRLIVDDQGDLWVRSFPEPGMPRARWHVFDPTGVERAQLQVPVQFEMSAVDDTSLLGIWTDAAGIQSIRAYALTRR